MIPKIIWTIWVGDAEIPTWVQDCIKTHWIEGYEHRFINSENCYKDAPYVRECLEAKKWAKAADYLRIYYLYNYGGVYLDSDVTVLPGKNFDSFLGDTIFCGLEENGFASNAIIGSVPEHPLMETYLRGVETNFIGSGDMVFQPGMYYWTEMVKFSDHRNDVVKYPPEYFLPYNHHMDRLKLTENSVCIHHFNKSWLK